VKKIFFNGRREREKKKSTFRISKSWRVFTTANLFAQVCFTPRVDPTKIFFLRFFFFGVKLGHFTINNFFLYVTKMQAYQQKTEKFFVSEEQVNISILYEYFFNCCNIKSTSSDKCFFCGVGHLFCFYFAI